MRSLDSAGDKVSGHKHMPTETSEIKSKEQKRLKQCQRRANTTTKDVMCAQGDSLKEKRKEEKLKLKQ